MCQTRSLGGEAGSAAAMRYGRNVAWISLTGGPMSEPCEGLRLAINVLRVHTRERYREREKERGSERCGNRGREREEERV